MPDAGFVAAAAGGRAAAGAGTGGGVAQALTRPATRPNRCRALGTVHRTKRHDGVARDDAPALIDAARWVTPACYNAGVSVLYAYAATAEAGDLATDARCVRVGVGKVAAAVTLRARLAQDRPDGVVAFGVAGTYAPARSIGSLCIVTAECLGDEGVDTPTGFVDVAALGLDDAPTMRADATLLARVQAALPGVPAVRGTTVSTGSGTDARAQAIAARTGAQIETMEGAALAWACAHAGVPWVGVRAISNRTGDRDRGGWDLPTAAAAIQDAVRRLWAAGI